MENMFSAFVSKSGSCTVRVSAHQAVDSGCGWTYLYYSDLVRTARCTVHTMLWLPRLSGALLAAKPRAFVRS